MQKVLILGAGKIGALISGFLAECRDYEVHVADVNGNAANSVVAAHGLPNLHAYELDAIAEHRGYPCMVVSDNGTELTSNAAKTPAAMPSGYRWRFRKRRAR